MINKIGNKIKNKINEHLIDEPYKIEILNEIDVTKQKPYTIKVNFLYKDKIFEKRMNNLLKEKKYIFDYQFYDKNVGTLFKPIYKNQIDMKLIIDNSIKYNIIDKIVIETVSFGFIEVQLKDTLPLKRLNKCVFSFSNKENQQLFSEKLKETLNSFFEKEYIIYEKIKRAEN